MISVLFAVFFFFFETRHHCVARLASNMQPSCLSLLSSWVSFGCLIGPHTGFVAFTAWVLCSFSQSFDLELLLLLCAVCSPVLGRSVLQPAARCDHRESVLSAHFFFCIGV
jgi:hypothetical protein